MNTQTLAIIMVLVAGLIGAFGPIYLKKGTEKIDLRKLSTIIFNPFLIIGIAVYGIGTIIFIPALRWGEVSVLYPLVGLMYVWVSIYSIILLKEKKRPLKG